MAEALPEGTKIKLNDKGIHTMGSGVEILDEYTIGGFNDAHDWFETVEVHPDNGYPLLFEEDEFEVVK